MYGPSLHLIIASSGNAGFAAACAAHAVGVRCTVYIPEGVAERTLRVLRGEGAEVVVVGKIYAEALEVAARVVKSQGNA
jgi:L-serine/L-threonine ammonia-lyase